MIRPILIVYALYFTGFLATNGQNSTSEITTTAVALPTTTRRPNSCQNGGVCSIEFLDNGICTNCSCPDGYLGNQCEMVLLRLNIRITFESLSTLGDTTNLVQAIQNELDTNQVVNINQQIFNNTLTMNIVTYIQREISWNNSVNVQSQLEVNLTRLFIPDFLQSIFGNTNTIFVDLTVDIDECASLWSDCNENARCINEENGFECQCLRGFNGDGRTCIEILCQISNAPPTPSLASRTIVFENGTLIENPESVLPFGVTIEFSCPGSYNLEEAVTGSASTEVAQCTGTPPLYRNSNWSGADVMCSIDRSFAIAIGLSVLSCLVMLMVIGCFYVSSCVKREQKVRHNRDDDNLAFETSVLEEH